MGFILPRAGLYCSKMQLEKISGGQPATIHSAKNDGRTAPGRNPPPAKTVQPAQAPKSPGASTSYAPVSRSVSGLVAATGLPADRLSAAIVSFARYFSLPLKPELLAALRRQAFAPAAAQTTPVVPGETGRVWEASLPKEAPLMKEAYALAAAAAEGKGVELTPRGLEAYALAIDPDRQEQRGEGHNRKRHKERDDKAQDAAAKKTISARELRDMAIESAEKDPLLSLLNRLPGKNNRRWLVFPFHFSDREFRVTLRILLEGESQRENQALSVDIAESGEHERRWLFAAEAEGGSVRRLTVFFQPRLPARSCARFARELSGFTGIPTGHISVQEFSEPFPCESGRGNDLLRSINEAV